MLLPEIYAGRTGNLYFTKDTASMKPNVPGKTRSPGD